jgi:hypothetical protein
MSDLPDRIGRLLLLLLAVSALAACVDLETRSIDDVDDTDYWDSSLVFVQHIDVVLLAGTGDLRSLGLSGILSAVAATGNDLYFIDQGAGKLVHLSLATMQAKILTTLRDARSGGLHAGVDGSLFVIDRFNREIIAFDPFQMEARRYSLNSLLGNPSDVALTDFGQTLVVIDELDGRMATIDVFGGVMQLGQVQPPGRSVLMSARAVSSTDYTVFVLDGEAGEVIGFDRRQQAIGNFGTDELLHPVALATDSCGRLFVSDDDDSGIYIGFADMLLPGFRVSVPELEGKQTIDLWTDDTYLYAATHFAGIFIFLLDPSCQIR